MSKIALFGSYGWGDGQWMRDWEDRCRAAGANIIIILVIAIIIFFAVKNTISHFKGDGGCCGGGSGVKMIRPKKLEKVVAVKTIRIEGMVCDNCSARIHNALNSIDGVNAKVNRSKGLAVVKLGREFEEEKLKKAVTDLGYEVVMIEQDQRR